MGLLRILPLTALLLSAAAPVDDDWNIPRLNIYQLAYPVEWNGRTIMLGARLQLPAGVNGKMPAIIMMHGTGGIRYSGVYYAAALNSAGIATLEVDQWGGRGLAAEPASRPKNLGDNLPDIGGAYRLLAARPDIDAARIGLMGSSMGAGETMFMMTRHNSDSILGPGVHFKAAAALYPVCWRFNHVPDSDFNDLVDAPIRIMVGDADDYDDGADACEQLRTELAPVDASHVSVRVFPGGTHIFDSFTGPYEFNDPRANRRNGGTVHVRPDAEARRQARDELVGFFTTTLLSK
jgi:dienelactone hydrolase